MPRAFRVRFSKQGRSVDPSLHIDAASDPALAEARPRQKSRYGCLECKKGKVKCDEAHPSCNRCQRRGIKCTVTARLSRWRLEKPGFDWPPSCPAPSCSLRIDARLLQWWMDATCKILVLDLHLNPLSLPLIEHLRVSPALCLALESFSLGHRGCWATKSRVEFFEKRSHALSLCREELTSKAVPLETSFYTVMLLGLTTPFMEDIDDYGKEHLIGARTILEILLRQNDSTRDPKIEQLLAYYTWWDMSCSFSVDPREIPALSTSEVLSVTSRGDAGPVGARFAGCMVEIYHLLGLLLRYCMQVLRGGARDPEHERTLELALTSRYRPDRIRDEDVLFAEAFRNHGLIILYRICRIRRTTDVQGGMPWTDNSSVASRIHGYALKIISLVLPTQIGTPFWNSLAIPLLTAGSELTVDDQVLRNNVREAFSSVLNQCRTNTVARAKDLLEEVWIRRDSGIEISYLELALQKGWNFSLV
ncbi:hypothetical protein H2204_014502 [Knufia peltigerae]|uniref:Zn(2)-C6 fungal-type domain-containing protein n=1 Tax=Knufia peltigerae TaxID=1002370 RepID=A0AA38XJX3_9EURO|nr:hypothetical protein H2204_014502 [Knufia peltigerae]